MEESEDKHVCLYSDVESIVVETDEENPEAILVIDRSDTPIQVKDGFRVRMKFITD